MKVYGVLVHELRINHLGVNTAIFIVIIDILRRFLLAVSLVFLVNNPIIIVLMQNFVNLFYTTTIMYLSPYKKKFVYIQVVFNELCILAVNYHYYFFTNFVSDAE